jgi:hypothetical protein
MQLSLAMPMTQQTSLGRVMPRAVPITAVLNARTRTPGPTISTPDISNLRKPSSPDRVRCH